MILSKTPIVSSRLFPLPKTALRERHNMVVGVFEGVVELPQNSALRIYTAHLSARSRHDRVAQINATRDIIARAPVEGGAWTGELVDPLWQEDAVPPPMPGAFVLLGDFNLEAKDPEYDYLVGPGNGDLVGDSAIEKFLDTWVITGHDKNEGITFSYDPTASDSQGLRVDFAFVDRSMARRVLGARIDGLAQGSDHQPYWLELDDAPYD